MFVLIITIVGTFYCLLFGFIVKRQSHRHDARPAHWKSSNFGQFVVVRWVCVTMRYSCVERAGPTLCIRRRSLCASGFLCMHKTVRGARRTNAHARRTPAMRRARWTNARHTRSTRWACKCPPNSGSLYYNYKGLYTVVLMALVDAGYKFIWAVIGGMGSASDAQIYNASELKECVEDGSLGFPDPESLPNDNRRCPIFRQRRCLCPTTRHDEAVCTASGVWRGRSLAVRWARAACALHARAIRSARQQHDVHSLTFLKHALCMRYACALHTSSALATRCPCVVNSLASSKFGQKFDAQRRTGHIFHFSMRATCDALVWLGL